MAGAARLPGRQVGRTINTVVGSGTLVTFPDLIGIGLAAVLTLLV